MERITAMRCLYFLLVLCLCRIGVICQLKAGTYLTKSVFRFILFYIRKNGKNNKFCVFSLLFYIHFRKMCDNSTQCPICDKLFALDEIESHVNKCIFLNCPDEQQKRKRSVSPVLVIKDTVKQLPSFKQLSPCKETSSTSKIRRTDNQVKCQVVETTDKYKPSKLTDSKDCGQQAKRDLNHLSFIIPLAKQVQPNTFEDFFGQSNVLGEDTILRSLLENGDIPNMILWGPPGCGKTSLAGVVCQICKKQPTKLKFVSLSAINSGVKDVQNILTIAKNDLKFGKRTILFMDEIHRFNKKQQDSFLESVEKGEIILIGATTENPSFIINSALLSRCRVIVMNKLDVNDIYSILRRAVETLGIEVVDDVSDNNNGNVSEDTR